MPQDILYKEAEYVFSYRVGGILIRNGKILLQKPLNDDYAIIGGHVSGMETSVQALQREFFEEIHANIHIHRLLAVGELFFPWGNRTCHQICLYYLVDLEDAAAFPLEGSFLGFDECDNLRTDLEYRWIPLEQLSQLTIYPPEVISHILSGDTDVLHFVYKE